MSTVNEEIEEWRPIPSVPEYEASSWGRIRRIKHEKPMPHGGVRTYGGEAWPGVWEPEQGRYIFVFKGKTRRVARVICEAFHGPPPFPKAKVLHLNENATINRPGNLAWGTQKENLAAPGFRAYAGSSRRGRPVSKITDTQAIEIISRAAAGEKQAALAREFGVSACHVSRMIGGHVRKGLSA